MTASANFDRTGEKPLLTSPWPRGGTRGLSPITRSRQVRSRLIATGEGQAQECADLREKVGHMHLVGPGTPVPDHSPAGHRARLSQSRSGTGVN